MQGGEIKASGTAEELLSAMPEEVWSLEVEKKEIERYMRNYKVSNVKTIPGGAVLRLISSEKPNSRAVREEATLEDLFLDYFGERAGENDDEI